MLASTRGRMQASTLQHREGRYVGAGSARPRGVEDAAPYNHP